MKSLLILSALLLISINSLPDPNIYIFLAIGQSNMEGQGAIADQDRTCKVVF